MAKKGMARPDWTKLHPKNEAFVPGIQGKAKSGKKKANPIIARTMGADNDLARDNLENDLPYADLQDL